MIRRPRLVGFAAGAVLLASCGGPPAQVPDGAAPVLLVHGHGESPAVFDALIGHLMQAGYPRSWLTAVELSPADGANVDAAWDRIAPAVEELLVRAGQPKVDVLAHSMGAVSSRWYATRIAPERVRTLVSVVGANHGTDALCAFADPGGREMCPAHATDARRNAVQVELNGVRGGTTDETPYGRGVDPEGTATVPPGADREIRYVAVAVPGDRWIVPHTSSELAGADAVTALPAGVAVEQTRPGNLLLREPVDHDSILRHDGFFALIDAVLADAAVLPDPVPAGAGRE